nr:hypothetical protein [Schlegelella koreensis]
MAAVDIGSNSFWLEIGEWQGGRYRCVDAMKETVRLGGGLGADGLLEAGAAARGLACLERFGERLAGFAPQQVRAVATQTLREARNRAAFLARAEAALGFPVEVIGGRDEAHLIYAGVARLQPSPARRLVVDVGGRSTELIVGCDREVIDAESFPIGSVSLSMQHFADGRLDAAAFGAAERAAAALFEPAIGRFARADWAEALGSSGTVSAIARVLRVTGLGRGAVGPDALEALIERCLVAGHVDRLDLPGLTDERRQVIAGCLSILHTLVRRLGIDDLQPAAGALRHGLIADLEATRTGAG